MILRLIDLQRVIDQFFNDDWLTVWLLDDL
jgi:hypothetical protein